MGARAKEGKGGGRGEKKIPSPHPLPAPFDSPYLLLSSGSFNIALSRANCALKENACTAGYDGVGREIRELKVMLTLYRLGLLFTGDFGAISKKTKRSSVALIYKVESRISDRLTHYLIIGN